MDPLRITEKGGVFYLRGAFNEGAKFGPLLSGKPPLKLNLSGIDAANSLGVKIFVNFILDLKETEVEFHECSLVATEIFNSFPAALGNPPQPERVKSFMGPFECENCGHEWQSLVKILDHQGRKFEGLHSKCKKCGTNTSAAPYVSDLMVFLEQS